MRARRTDGTFEAIHGKRHTKLYSVWCAMKERCNNPHSKSYLRYGNRGIKVCKEWEDSFSAFYEWSKISGYQRGLTIDRIDNEKGYSPDNCRWVTTAQQNRNYSRNHYLTYQGKTLCITDWEAETGIGRATIMYRIKAGKTIEQIFDKRDGRSLRYGKQLFLQAE